MKIVLIILISLYLYSDVVNDREVDEKTRIVLKKEEIKKYIQNVKKEYLKKGKKDLDFDYNPFFQYSILVKELNKNKIKKNRQKRIIKKDLENKKYNLFGIFNNQININKVWYENGKKIDGYLIKKINMNEVNLIKNKKIIKLKMNEKKIFY